MAEPYFNVSSLHHHYGQAAMNADFNVQGVRSHSDDMTVRELTSTFYAEPSEHETINHTLHEINQLSQFNVVQEWLQSERISWQGLRNYASFMETEETIPAEIVEGDSGPRGAPKKMLVIIKGNDLAHSELVTPWSQFLHRAPGHAKTTN